MRFITVFVLSLCCSFAFAQDSVVVLEERNELLRAGVASLLKFKNGEVIIRCTSEMTPKNILLASLGWKRQQTARVLVDYDKQRCFMIEKSEPSDASESTEEKNPRYVIYRDGKGRDSSGLWDALDSQGQAYFVYLEWSSLWRPELAGMTESAGGAGSPKQYGDEYLKLNLKDPKDLDTNDVTLSVQTMPDGTKHFTRESKEYPTKSLIVYDPKFPLPIETTFTRDADKMGKITDRTAATFETVKGIARGLSYDTQYSEMRVVAMWTGHVHVVCKTKIEYQWIQFNEDALKWPDEQAIIASKETMMQFVNDDNSQ